MTCTYVISDHSVTLTLSTSPSILTYSRTQKHRETIPHHMICNGIATCTYVASYLPSYLPASIIIASLLALSLISTFPQIVLFDLWCVPPASKRKPINRVHQSVYEATQTPYACVCVCVHAEQTDSQTDVPYLSLALTHCDMNIYGCALTRTRQSIQSSINSHMVLFCLEQRKPHSRDGTARTASARLWLGRSRSQIIPSVRRGSSKGRGKTARQVGQWTQQTDRQTDKTDRSTATHLR